MNENCKKKKCDNKIIIRDRIKKSYFPIPIKSNIKHIKNKSWFDINCNSFLTDNKIENKIEKEVVSDNESDIDRKSTRLNSSHIPLSRMPSSA